MTDSTCEAKRMADGKVCGKPAKFREVWDHPERFQSRHLCGQHARRLRVEPIPAHNSQEQL